MFLRRWFNTSCSVLKQGIIEISDANFNQQLISKYFNISFARSSGAGGQHVNTTDSKAIIKLSISDWYAARDNWIPAKDFDIIMKNFNDQSTPINKKFPYFTQNGDILIMSSITRYRDKNLSDCFNKFINAIKICSQDKKEISIDTLQKWDKLSKRDNENRLKDKKLKKDKKTSRKKVNLNDY
jgi:peptidyl-tRNA hydrolase ICT1